MTSSFTMATAYLSVEFVIKNQTFAKFWCPYTVVMIITTNYTVLSKIGIHMNKSKI